MLIVYILFILGVVRYRFSEYWKWALLLLAWLFIITLLFSSGGTLENSNGDGIVTHQVRVATNDGPAMAVFGIVVLVLMWGPAIWFARKMHKAVKARGNPRAEAQATGWPRKASELIVLTCAFVTYGFWAYADLLQANQEVTAQQALSTESITAELEKAAAEINASVPQKLDPMTTLVRASVEGRTFIYHFSLGQREGTDQQLLAFLAKNIAPKTCANQDQRLGIDELGIVYRYSYTFPDSVTPVNYEVSAATCRGLGQ